MIEVEGPDGVVIEFPEGTSPDVIKGVMAKRYGGKQPAPEQPAQPRQSLAGGLIDSLTQGAAFGFGDELTGLESAVLGRTPEGGWFDYSRPFVERYQTAVDAERGQQDQFREDAPIASTAAEVAGALATGVGAGRAGLTLMGRARSVPGAIGLGAAEGAGYGGMYAAGEADEGDRGEAALYGAGMGAATGGAVSGAAAQIGKILAGRQAAGMAPSVQELKGRAGAAFERARSANPTFDGFDQFATQAYQTLADQGYNVRFHPQLAFVLDDIEKISRQGTAPDYRTLSQLRRSFDMAAGADVKNKDQQRLAKMGKDALDAFMDAAAGPTPNPGNLPAVAGQAGPTNARAAALADMREGNALWARAKKGELIEELIQRAEDRSGSLNGANPERALRLAARRILDNPRMRRGFSADEIQAIRDFVRGTEGGFGSVQNILRGVGNLSPTRGGLTALMGGAGTAGAVGTLGPMGAVPMVASVVADALAHSGSRAQAHALSSMVRGGPNASAILNQRRLSPAAQAVVRALSAQSGNAVTP